MRRDEGFTLLEVLIAMLIGTIGLLGTIAVQQAIISASRNANDAAVAMRLASQKVEELSSRTTDTQAADQNTGLSPIATQAGQTPIWWPTDSGGNQVPEYVDAEGQCLRDSSGKIAVPQPADLGRYRWRRQWKVINTGVGLPYVISVIVTYNNDVGDAKTTRLDLERRKSW
jgi:prepilin-type N-terminal cleavage/methylation domain-containing protein